MRARLTMLAAALSVAAVTAAPRTAEAQALGPQRQFLALEPLYEYTRLDAGSGAQRISLNGYGARLWLNLAPFSGPSQNLIGKIALGLYTAYTPSQGSSGVTTHHYGADVDVHFVDYPLGGTLDPYLIVGGGALRINSALASQAGFQRGTVTRLTASPGGGFRIQLGNRFQLKGEGKDMIIFSNRNKAGTTRTTNNLQVTASLGLTF